MFFFSGLILVSTSSVCSLIYTFKFQEPYFKNCDQRILYLFLFFKSFSIFYILSWSFFIFDILIYFFVSWFKSEYKKEIAFFFNLSET